MAKTMTRGKQQILFNYLPGKTFDFERGPIARVAGIRGIPRTDLNQSVVIRKIAEHARAWSAPYRPGLSDQVLAAPNRFVLLDPIEVEAEMFPKVFWCDNGSCGQIVDASTRDRLPGEKCPRCREGYLGQMRFVKIHRCGAIEPLSPPPCPQCHKRNIGLSARGSERLSAFRWICHDCGHAFAPFAGYCRQCSWPDDPSDPHAKSMDIEVHRAGRTYYPQTTVLLNIPHRELESFFARPDWQIIVAARFLGLQEAMGRGLSDWGSSTDERNPNSSGLSGSQLDAILAGGASPEEIVARLRQAQEQRRHRDEADQGLSETLSKQTGVPATVWTDAGTELLEAITPFENAAPELVKRASNNIEAQEYMRQLGFDEIALVQDYTIINATFGYSRAEYAPDECWLNPFPPDRAFDGKLPIFVDKVQADALLLALDPVRVLRWLRLNGHNPSVPAGANEALSAKSYFVQLFHGTSLYHSIGADQSELRMVFGLLHTLSHLCVRQASLLCGLEKTSLSEYILPKALTLAMYCNHRFGATIGALTALFEQSLQLWLNGIRDTRACVYDPLCKDHGATCHACTHLAETSCRFFNLNLSRAFLFGGADTTAGPIRYGYFDLPP